MTVKRFMMPTDYTGELASNRVVGEVHELDNTQFKLVVPLSGFFYTHNLKVYDEKMTKLEPGTHYQTIYANEEVQMRTPGLEVCGALIIKPNVKTKTVSLTYNQVGGPYANYTSAIEAALIALDLDGREIDFANLKGLPEYFTAGAHAEDIGNVFGFEYVKHGIERLRETLERSGKTTNDQVGALLNDLIDSINLMFTEHAKDAKAHGTTANDVGAYSKLESDEVARQFRETIEAIREEIQTIADTQNGSGEEMQAVQTKLRLLSRRVTVVSNVAMNAIRRMGGNVTVMSGGTGGGGDGLTMAQVREVVGEVDAKFKLPSTTLALRANTTLPIQGLYYKRVLFTGAATLTLGSDWPEGSHLVIEADYALTIPGAKCVIASPNKFTLPNGVFDTVELTKSGHAYWFTKVNGTWRCNLDYKSSGPVIPGWVDDDSYWTTDLSHTIAAKSYARKVDVSVYQTLTPTGPEDDNKNGPTATVVCKLNGVVMWTENVPALNTGTYDQFDPTVSAGYGQPTVDLPAGQTLTFVWTIGNNPSGVAHTVKALVNTKKQA